MARSAQYPRRSATPIHGRRSGSLAVRDGTRLAYASHGSGPPMIVVSCWLSHLQHDWESPVWRHFLEDLGKISTVVRYDERDFGMSDWNVADFSMDARLADLEAIVESLAYERFALLGMSNGSGVAMAYAARQPDRVKACAVRHCLRRGGHQRRPEGWPRRNVPKPDRGRLGARGPASGEYSPPATSRRFGGAVRSFDDLQRMSRSGRERCRPARSMRQSEDITQDIAANTCADPHPAGHRRHRDDV